MNWIIEINRVLHIIAGASTLIAGPIALFYNFKNPKNHRLAGRVFFYAMLWVCGSAMIGFFHRPELPFYQFLGALSFFVLFGVVRGVRAIQIFKGKQPAQLDKLLVGLAFLVGSVMVAGGVFQLTKGQNFLPLAILFSVFGVWMLSGGVQLRRFLSQSATLDRRFWYQLHISSMVGSFTASTTAFLVQTCHFLPWFIQWFGPTVLLTPLTIYFLNKLKLRNRDLK